jgi:hypothetical protein
LPPVGLPSYRERYRVLRAWAFSRYQFKSLRALSTPEDPSPVETERVTTWYTLSIDDGDGTIDLRLYESVEHALQDACLVISVGMRPIALWDGVERLMTALEIQGFCRRSSGKLVGR